MTAPERIADKYIKPSGRTAEYGRDQFTDDLITATSFLAWAEYDGAYYAGVDAGDALRAMCRMLDMYPIKLRKIAMGEPL